MSEWINQIKWDDNGLVPAIAQETGTGKILMMAWMNQGIIATDPGDRPCCLLLPLTPETLAQGRGVGPSTDCEVDPGRLRRRRGVAGAWSRRAVSPATPGVTIVSTAELHGDEWVEVLPVIKDPNQIYG